MSHTSTITTVPIKSLEALERAITDIRNQGVKIEVMHNVVPRAYSRGQAGMSEVSPFVIRVAGAPYDIALYESTERPGTYDLATDFYRNGEVIKAFGADQHLLRSIDRSTDEGEARWAQAALGRLYQRYNINITKMTAARQGRPLREVQQEDGSVQLRIAVAA